MLRWNAVLKNPIVLAILFSSIFTYGQICSNVYFLTLIVEAQYPLHLHDLTLQIVRLNGLEHQLSLFLVKITHVRSADLATLLFLVFIQQFAQKLLHRIGEASFFGATSIGNTE